MRGGVCGAFWNFQMHGGGKISIPPVVGVRIFSGTTQCIWFQTGISRERGALLFETKLPQKGNKTWVFEYFSKQLVVCVEGRYSVLV